MTRPCSNGVRGAHAEARPAPADAVYGLAEWHAERIRAADIIANPGCYPDRHAPPAPAAGAEGRPDRGTVIVNAISGISGAGRKEKTDLLYVRARRERQRVQPGHHPPARARDRAGARRGDGSLSLLFTPHMAPLRRGMAVTTVVGALARRRQSGREHRRRSYGASYGGRPFISLAGSRVPQTRDVWGSNRCDIGWRREGGHLMLFSAIDNLVKGASGQAVQNMNIRFGIAETAGLRAGGEL